MTAALVVVVLVAAALAWFVFGGQGAPVAPPRENDIDHDELEAAERDVQEAADEGDVRDWGPGAGRPPVA